MKQACKKRPAQSESREWNSRRLRAVLVLTTMAAIAAATPAYAVPVRFDNPPGAGHFDWTPPDPVTDVELDVRLPASSQPGLGSSPSDFGQHVDDTRGQVIGRQPGAELQLGGLYDLFLVGVDELDLIPSGFAWDYTGYTYYSGFGSELPEGQHTYLGLRFDVGNGIQYGWIEVVRTGMELDAFAWGYETDPGVPVAAGAPEPGTLAMLAVGVGALAGRRRRSAE